MTNTSSGATSLETWPAAPGADEKAKKGPKPAGPQRHRHVPRVPHRRARPQTTTTTAKTGTSFREYGQYKELFYNLTLRELRAKYKRSVIGWGWSMINPLANMMIYTIVFAVLLKTPPLLGEPSGLHVYALMLLCAMLPWNFFQSSVMESMGSLLGNQNLIQKTYFPRELIPAATVASKIVSHLIEMSLLVVVIVAFGNWRALMFLPGVLLVMAVVATFAFGLSLLFSLSNVFYRDIQHFSAILFFMWMFLTPIAYPFSQVGGGLTFGATGSPVLANPRTLTLFGHIFNLGTLFKLNPMTDAVLTMQSFVYSGNFPSSTYRANFPVTQEIPAHLVNGKMVPAAAQIVHVIHSNVSWGDFGYLVLWAIAALIVGLWVFRKYEARLPEEL